MEKYQEVLDILDDEIPFLDRDHNSVDKNTEGGIASIYYLRGVIYSQQSDLDNAKKWFKKALLKVFNELLINRMVTSKEGIEWDFVHSLKFDEQLEYEDAILSK
ncbi:hypothetical protein C2G38_2150114 [Gigaspora rosea]|uniref:Uncharacterized protein n=1 Tax=Gigaspora rosea TaxID=44941 RepID=A0A397U420_9GLOM|nr:hypothetical protein C2G38_2150114 [Gigaspora rosea]